MIGAEFSPLNCRIARIARQVYVRYPHSRPTSCFSPACIESLVFTVLCRVLLLEVTSHRHIRHCGRASVHPCLFAQPGAGGTGHAVVGSLGVGVLHADVFLNWRVFGCVLIIGNLWLKKSDFQLRGGGGGVDTAPWLDPFPHPKKGSIDGPPYKTDPPTRLTPGDRR